MRLAGAESDGLALRDSGCATGATAGLLARLPRGTRGAATGLSSGDAGGGEGPVGVASGPSRMPGVCGDGNEGEDAAVSGGRALGKSELPAGAAEGLLARLEGVAAGVPAGVATGPSSGPAEPGVCDGDEVAAEEEEGAGPDSDTGVLPSP